MNLIESKIYEKIQKIQKIKQRINEYFLIQKSMNNLILFAKRFYLCSIGFDEIYLGNKNSKRFKITILTCILIWIITLYHLLLLISDYLWSTIDGPFLPEHFRTFMLYFVILFFYASILKTCFFLSEITHQTTKSPFKIFYFLMNNLKSKHELNEKNYKKLALISRLIQIIILNYGSPMCLILPLLIFAKITISSQFKIAWIIHKHNELSIEIHNMNLCIRIVAAAFFVSMAFIRIISLYLIMNLKNNLIIFLMENIFILTLIFCFALTYLLSKQIKSAHLSYKFIQKICCKYKMKIKLKLKVS